MDSTPLITSTLPDDDRRLSYSYLGSRIYAWNADCFVHDSIRTRPTLVLGSTGYGKTELLLSLAFSDMAKKRPVFFIDGKCDLETLHKLHFYAKQANRPFYAFLPFQDGDRLTCSWNPFVSDVLSISTITEAFINSYSDPQQALNRNDPGGAGYYIETQRAVCSNLMRALHSSGYQYSISDIRYLIENSNLLDSKLVPLLKPEGFQSYGELKRLVSKEGRDFPDVMSRFTNFLSQFRHWSVNSYNPTITIERIIDERAVLYAGLPVNSQPVEMAAIGNMLINLLKATSSVLQTKGVGLQTQIGCFADEAGSFVDSGLAEWICKVRSTGFLLSLGLQTLGQLEGRRSGFGSEIRSNAPNVMLFNPKDRPTAEWFSGLVGSEARRSVTASLVDSDVETGSGSVRLNDTPRVHPDAILALNPGQFFYSPPVTTVHPPLLAASMLPAPDSKHPFTQFRRINQFPKAKRRGLFLDAVLHANRFGATSSRGGGKK